VEPVLLASKSPRRKDLLQSIGIPFHAKDPQVDEDHDLPEEPAGQARMLAERKLRAILPERGHLLWVVGCDTVVDVDGAVLGKPGGVDEARGFLRRLAGREHRVHSGVALYSAAAGTVDVRVALTRVLFRSLTEQEIEWYLATGEWEDVAGGYRIQGRGALLVDSIAGSYSNVVGLPLETFYGMLVAAGYRF
jgi:septum formation protein